MVVKQSLKSHSPELGADIDESLKCNEASEFLPRSKRIAVLANGLASDAPKTEAEESEEVRKEQEEEAKEAITREELLDLLLADEEEEQELQEDIEEISKVAEEERRLNEEQRELVTKNHDLIYSFAHKMKISIDDYYDVLAIGLCKAAKVYDPSKGTFSTLAYRCMNNEVNMYWRKVKNENEANVLSYDSSDVRKDKDNQSSFLECFADWQSCRNMSFMSLISDVVNELTNKEKKILILMLKEYTCKEIADTIGCSVQNVYYYIDNIRQKASEYLYYN